MPLSFQSMTSDVRARGSAMTSLHVTRRMCIPWFHVVSVSGGLGKLVDIFGNEKQFTNRN